MKHRFLASRTCLLLACLLLAACAPPADAQVIAVRLLNLSDAPFGPVLVATHPYSLSPLFDPSEAPSPALRLLSEGAGSALEAEARDVARRTADIQFGVIDGPGPGETASFVMPASSYHRNISLVSPIAGGGFAGFHALRAANELISLQRDVTAWEAAETVMVHRSRPSPIARAWLLWSRPGAGRTAQEPSRLTPGQARERAACLEGSATCIWRLENGRGYCSDCLPPLRPNAARTHCIG
ncbi:MAG: hypothetical protein OXN96_19075 [Bryobacterales bacterium]|nr:hypothetical protein [Bryobacterales bacterium]